MLGALLGLGCLWHGASAASAVATEPSSAPPLAPADGAAVLAADADQEVAVKDGGTTASWFRHVVVGSSGQLEGKEGASLLRREAVLPAHIRPEEAASVENVRRSTAQGEERQHGLQPDKDPDGAAEEEELFAEEDAEEDAELTALAEGASTGAGISGAASPSRRRRGVTLQACNIVSGGGLTMVCPPGFTYSSAGVCKGKKDGSTCKDWGTGSCDPRKYVLKNGLPWPNTIWRVPKSGKATVKGAVVLYTSGWWKTHGAPVHYCLTPGGAPSLVEIASCSASSQKTNYHCMQAMDGVNTGQYGWAYNAVKDSWVSFNLAGTFDISRMDVISGVGRTTHHFLDFKIKTQTAGSSKWVGVYGLNFVNIVPKGSRVEYDRAILTGHPQRVDLSFTKKKSVSAVQLHVLKTDHSSGDGVLTEVLIYRHTGCQDLALAPGNVALDNTFWKAKCAKIPTSAYMVQVQMGLITDTFKPLQGVSFCDMLTSSVKHQWSPDGGFTWKTPTHYPGHFGGSTGWWPKKNVQGDSRTYISFWGSVRRRDLRGGCCNDGSNKKAAWERSFTMRWCMIPVGAQTPCARGMVHTKDESGTSLGCTACHAGYYDSGLSMDTCTRCHGSSRRRRATVCTKNLVEYQRVGNGECSDARGIKYSTFKKAGCHTQDECQAGCENFDSDQCRGFTFFTETATDCGKCELRMEAKFKTSSSGWLLVGTALNGAGAIKTAVEHTSDKRVCYSRVVPDNQSPIPLKKPIAGWTCPAAITVKGFLKNTDYDGVYTLAKDLHNGVPSYKKGKNIIASNKKQTAWTIGPAGMELARCDEDNFPMALTDTSCFTDQGRCAFQEHNGKEYVGMALTAKSAQAACDSDGVFLLPVSKAQCPTNGELPRCDAVVAGQMCEGDGECGTDDSLDNCDRYDVYYKQAPADTTTTTPNPMFLSAGWGVSECPAGYLRIMDFSSCLEGGLQVHPEAKDGILPPFAIGMWPSEPAGCYVKVYPDGVRRLVHLNHPPAGGVIHPFQSLVCRYKGSKLVELVNGTVTPCPGSPEAPPPE